MERIGKYKSAGDQLTRTTMSKENCEMLTALLDNIYGHWLDEVSSLKGAFSLIFFGNLQVSNNFMSSAIYTGKERENVVNFINEGVFDIERLKEDGWITNIKYDDEVHYWDLCISLSVSDVIQF